MLVKAECSCGNIRSTTFQRLENDFIAVTDRGRVKN